MENFSKNIKNNNIPCLTDMEEKVSKTELAGKRHTYTRTVTDKSKGKSDSDTTSSKIKKNVFYPTRPYLLNSLAELIPANKQIESGSAGADAQW